MSTPLPVLSWLGSLSDPTRARLLRLLERHELAVGELCEIVQLPQSTVSRHLKTLSDDGWVASRREETSRLYQMAGEQPGARKLWSVVRDQLAASDTARHDDQRLERVLAARQARSQAFFAGAAARWTTLRTELFGPAFDLRALPGLLDERWTVGDLGCGTGELAESLAPFVRRVLAVDSSAAMLKAAQHRLKGFSNVELRRGELERLPLEDGCLDAALMMLVLHHLPDPARALAEMARVLKPGGRALVVDMQPHDRAEYRQQMGHVWLGFSSPQLEGWLSGTGLESVRVRPLPPDPTAKGPALFVLSASRRTSASSPTQRSSP